MTKEPMTLTQLKELRTDLSEKRDRISQDADRALDPLRARIRMINDRIAAIQMARKAPRDV